MAAFPHLPLILGHVLDRGEHQLEMLRHEVLQTRLQHDVTETLVQETLQGMKYVCTGQDNDTQARHNQSICTRNPIQM